LAAMLDEVGVTSLRAYRSRIGVDVPVAAPAPRP